MKGKLISFPAINTLSLRETVTVSVPLWATDADKFTLERMNDDSLPPANRGNLLLVYHTREIKFYHPCVITYDNRRMARVLQPQEDGSILLATSNPDYPSYIVSPHDFNFVGVVIEIWNDLKGAARWTYDSLEFQKIAAMSAEGGL